MRRHVLLMILGLMLLGGWTAAHADSIVVPLTIANVDLGLIGTFANVTVDVSGTGSAEFTVDANEALLGIGSNFGIQKFFFNFDPSLGLSASDIAPPSGWRIGVEEDLTTLPVGFNAGGGFGFYLVKISGTGGTRQDPLVFTISDPSIDSAWDFFVPTGTHHYVAHIAGFAAHNCQTSAYFTDSGGLKVPEPAALWLLGSGLVMVGFAARGRRRKS
jgi:hypothetical protein